MSEEYANVYASAATIYTVMRFHGNTRKKLERLFMERNEQQHKDFAMLKFQIPMRCIESIDETHKSGGDAYRKYGRTLINEPCTLLDRDPRSIPRTSTMMAVSAESGVMWIQRVVLGPAQNADDWRLFLHDRLEVYLVGHYVPEQPWEAQPDNCVLLLDNAAIHDEVGDEIVHANDMSFLRLPPYSPDLQPIEGVFNELKMHIKDRTYFNPGFSDKPRRRLAAASGLLANAQIRGQFTRGWKHMEAIVA